MNERTALVTGANKGIGRHIARLLADEGFTVHVGARDPERGERAVAEIGSRARLLVLDVTDPAGVAEAAAGVERLDVLVNNAGISPSLVPPTEADAEEFRRTYETNVFAVVTVTNAFLPALRRSAHPRIVNVSSGTASLAWSTGPNPQFAHGSGGAAAYRSSKAALNALTVLYAQTLAEEGFKVNALAPACGPPTSTRGPPRRAATRPRPRRAPSGSPCCRTTVRPAASSPGTARPCPGERPGVQPQNTAVSAGSSAPVAGAGAWSLRSRPRSKTVPTRMS